MAQKKRLPITQRDWKVIRLCVDMISAGPWDDSCFGDRPDLEKLLDKIDERIRDYNGLWPEVRLVSYQQLARWYSDAIANGEIDADVSETNPREHARVLNEAGIITIRK